MVCGVIAVKQVTGKSEAVVVTCDDNSTSDCYNSVSTAYDASLGLSSSVAHLQLECVPEHLTEVDEEVGCVADETGPAAAADTTASSDEALYVVDESAQDAVDTSVHIDSKTRHYMLLYKMQLLPMLVDRQIYR